MTPSQFYERWSRSLHPILERVDDTAGIRIVSREEREGRKGVPSGLATDAKKAGKGRSTSEKIGKSRIMSLLNRKRACKWLIFRRLSPFLMFFGPFLSWKGLVSRRLPDFSGKISQAEKAERHELHECSRRQAVGRKKSDYVASGKTGEADPAGNGR